MLSAVGVGLLLFSGFFFGCGDSRSTDRNDMPHHGIMRMKDTLTDFWACTLIHPSWVITAAHPFVSHGTHWREIEKRNKYPLEVAFGNVDFRIQGFPTRWDQTDFVTVPAGYTLTSTGRFMNDIAMVHLTGIIDISNAIYPIRLPWYEDLLPTDNVTIPLVDFLAAGSDSEKNYTRMRVFSSRLQLYPTSDCHPRENGVYANDILCVQGTEEDGTPCAPDPGSGLIGDPQCNGRNVLIGVFSRTPRRYPDGECITDEKTIVTLLAPHLVESFIFEYLNKSNVFFKNHHGFSMNEECWPDWCAEKRWCKATLPSLLHRHQQ